MQRWPFIRYANDYHCWHETKVKNDIVFYRPLGFVERTFDADGIFFGGRADINAGLDLEIRSSLSQPQLRERVLLAWTALRLQHVLLMSKAVDGKGYLKESEGERVFLIQPPKSSQDAVERASLDLVFVEDHYPGLDYEDFYHHLQNSNRVLDASQNLARLFVLPTPRASSEISRLRFIFVMGHQITDGLTNHTWLSHYLKLLNEPISSLTSMITAHATPASIKSLLPLPQEDLYPKIADSPARRRWFWAIAIVLRHVKKPQPACFANPLRRQTARASTIPSSKSYNEILHYHLPPPTTNTRIATAALSQASTTDLHNLCRSINVSVGAGCFVLVAMSMMALHEAQTPHVSLDARLPFIGSFPINPRPFFSHHSPPDSLMLAFSDGVVLPFLPSSLPFAPRFRLLARLAHRQLSRYQKRKPDSTTPPSHTTAQILPSLHLQLASMLCQKLPPFTHFPHSNPSIQLSPTPNPTMATCGISSIGRSLWRVGEYSLEEPLREGKDGFVADFRGNRQNVRAREGEFLVGVSGGEEVAVNVSYDEGAMDEGMVEEWVKLLQTMVDVEKRARL